jgi:hypothetical protein
MAAQLFNGLKTKFMNLLPAHNNTATTTAIANNNTTATTAATAATQQQQPNALTSNYAAIVCIVIAIMTVVLLYIFSNSFRTSRTLDSIGMYYQYQNIASTKMGSNVKLADCHVASAYNTAHVGYQEFDYINELIVKAVLRAGVRYIEFNIFNSQFGLGATPVVSNGYRTGEWKLTLNVLPFDVICAAIAENAFTIFDGGSIGVPNPDDMLVIGLNLNTQYNLACLDKVADTLLYYFRKHLLDSKYTYQQQNLAKAPMSELMGKVVFIASDGFQGSKLEELINGSWDLPNIRRVHYSEITNVADWSEFNKTGLTIVVPHSEGDIITANYDTTIPWQAGCQFIAMNYQIVDTPMDTYITHFKNTAIVVKSRTK